MKGFRPGHEPKLPNKPPGIVVNGVHIGFGDMLIAVLRSFWAMQEQRLIQDHIVQHGTEDGYEPRAEFALTISATTLEQVLEGKVSGEIKIDFLQTQEMGKVVKFTINNKEVSSIIGMNGKPILN